MNKKLLLPLQNDCAIYLLRRSHWIEQPVILVDLTKHLYFYSLSCLVLSSLSTIFVLRS